MIDLAIYNNKPLIRQPAVPMLKIECHGHALRAHTCIGCHFMGRLVRPASSICFLIRRYIENPFSKFVTS